MVGSEQEHVLDEYLRRGNFYRDWNLEEMIRKEQRRSVLTIDGAQVELELRSWAEPLKLSIANFSIHGQTTVAMSLNLTPVKLLRALKTVVDLRNDSVALAVHQQALDTVLEQHLTESQAKHKGQH